MNPMEYRVALSQEGIEPTQNTEGGRGEPLQQVPTEQEIQRADPTDDRDGMVILSGSLIKLANQSQGVKSAFGFYLIPFELLWSRIRL